MQNQSAISVCVIGGGPSGLVTLKELKEQGLSATCFDRNSSVGGVFSDLGTYDSLLLTISNYFMAFSDLMPTDERIRFWTRREYQSYLKRFVTHFNLEQDIKLNTEVVSAQKQADHWVVVTRCIASGEETSHMFDKVAFCSGNFQKPVIPDFDGKESFTGRIMHSSEYKNAEAFKGKRVVCVGLGESSTDITTEIGEVAEKTILSLRKYPIVSPKFIIFKNRKSYDPETFTVDLLSTSRFLNSLPDDLHEKAHIDLFKSFAASQNPATRIMGEWNLQAGVERQQFITKSERIFDAIADGKVDHNVSGILRLDGDNVVFKDGTSEKVDVIMCCTGFSFDIALVKNNVATPRHLYKQIFHPEYGDSMGCIGFARPAQGGAPVLAELQARYFALVCAGKRTLPDSETMVKLAEKDRERWEREFPISASMKSLVHYSFFAEELARLIGCEFKVSFFKQPKLWLKCYFGPLWPIQYRLRGPGARTELAEKIILEKAPVPKGEYHPIPMSILGLILFIRKILPVGPSLKPRKI